MILKLAFTISVLVVPTTFGWKLVNILGKNTKTWIHIVHVSNEQIFDFLGYESYVGYCTTPWYGDLNKPL